MRIKSSLILFSLIVGAVLALTSMKQEDSSGQKSGKELFRVNCGMCHSTSTKIIGPQLTSELIRSRNRKWLVSFVRNGMEMVNNGDTLANSLFLKYSKSPHPDFTEKLKEKEIKKIIEYLESSNFTKPAN